MRALAVAFLLLSAAAAAGSQGPVPAPPDHSITCANPRAAREYAEGLRLFHLGTTEAAIREFQAALRRDPACALAYLGISRAQARQGRRAEALAALQKAEELAGQADDREQRFISAWSKWLKAPEAPAERAKAMDSVRADLDRALATYSDDPELWLLRGEAAEKPLRATLYYLAALRMQPNHPFGTRWRPQVPPLPEIQPAATQPVPAPSPTPQLFEGLGVLSHPITTRSAQARAFYEQGLRLWHGYITPARVKNSAAVCFQQAASLDPDCAMAYWGLSLTSVPQMKPLDAANRALELAIKSGNDKERRYATARLLELGGRQKLEECLDVLDGAIAAYPDDIELWIWRGNVMATARGPSQGRWATAVPIQLAAFRMQPDHPAPNHELVHGYEALQMPALGWPHTEGFRRSAPNMPHANHMQAHLAMRLGRWAEAVDCGRTARQKSLAGFPELDPTHHIDIMVRALAHDGHFREAEAEPKAYREGLPWARLLQLKAVPEELEAWAQRRIERNAPDGFYIGAIARLDRNDLAGAEPLIAKVEEAWKKQPSNLYRYNEVKGRYLVQSGSVEEGLKLLREASAKAVKDYDAHSWGGGSYMLEVWGEAALRAKKWDEAEEAYHEALAHEHGSILGALGMQVVWEQRGRSDRVQHYAQRAANIWKDADPGALQRQLARIRSLAQFRVASRGSSQ